MPTIPKTFSNEKRFDKNPNDLFITPFKLALSCVKELEWISRDKIIFNNPTILDVGCGNGMWGVVTKEILPHSTITGVDISHYTLSDYDYNYIYWNTNFLDFSGNSYDLIIGNPPFSSKDNRHLAEDIVLHSIDLLAPNGYLGLLLKTEFVSSARRYENIFKNHSPLYQYSIYPRPYFNDRKGSNTIEYSFFIWDKNKNDETRLRWLNWR